MFYTYAHITRDTNQIFYIGKGSGIRAFEKGKDRNPHWTAVVNKHGYYATILAYWKTEQEAYDHEKLLIASFNDMGYNLTNKTPGGEGIPKGYKWSDEVKRKMALSRIGSKRTEETKKKMSASSAWRGHTYVTPGFGGHKHTEESRALMSNARKGNPQSPKHAAKRHESKINNRRTKQGLSPIKRCWVCKQNIDPAEFDLHHGDNCLNC